MEKAHTDFSDKKIVFFDGVCGLCNKSVDWLIRRDKNQHLLFSPLQGETAKILLSEEVRNELSTFVFLRNGTLLNRSDAALATLKDIGGGWKIFYVLTLIPLSFRNWIYNWVSRNRYKWFGKKETCRIPSKEERKRFLP